MNLSRADSDKRRLCFSPFLSSSTQRQKFAFKCFAFERKSFIFLENFPTQRGVETSHSSEEELFVRAKATPLGGDQTSRVEAYSTQINTSRANPSILLFLEIEIKA
jgi:hypothetical protein